MSDIYKRLEAAKRAAANEESIANAQAVAGTNKNAPIQERLRSAKQAFAAADAKRGDPLPSTVSKFQAPANNASMPAKNAAPSFGDIKRTLTYASPSRAQELLEQYRPHVSNEQYAELSKASGAFVKNGSVQQNQNEGFYSKPEPSEHLLMLQSMRNAQETTAERELGAVKQAQGEMKGLLIKQPDASDRFARRGSDGTYADTVLGMHTGKEYQTKNTSYAQREGAAAKVKKTVSEFLPTARGLEEYDAAYQREAAAYKKQLDDWKSTIRDAETIQAELDDVKNGSHGKNGRGGVLLNEEEKTKKIQLLQEELQWRDYFDHEAEYTQYAETYDSGEIPLAKLHSEVADTNARIVELEQLIRAEEKLLPAFELMAGQTERTPEQQKQYERIVARIEAYKQEIKRKKAEVESENREYDYYWSRILSEMRDSGAAVTRANEQTAGNIAQTDADLEKLYRYVGFVNSIRSGVEMKGWQDSVSLTDELFMSENLMQLTQEECEVFLYCCNVGNYEAAKIWLDELAPVLTARKGAAMGEKVDFPVLREAAVLLSSAATGVKNIGYGIGSLFADVDAPEASAGEYMVGHLQEKHKGSIAGYTTAAAASVGNQIPSLISYAINPALGKATTFFNTRGNAYIDAKRNGASHSEAWVYSTLVGAAETGLETVLGGLGGRVKGIIPEKLSKWISGAGKRFQGTAGRLVKDYAISTISELTEENLQNYLEPLFQMVAGMKDQYEAPGWEDFMETSIVTVLSSSAFYASNLPAKKKQLKFNETARTWAQKAMQIDEHGEIGQRGKKILELLDAGKDISPDYMNEIFALYGDLHKGQSAEAEEETTAQTDADGSESLLGVNVPKKEATTEESAAVYDDPVQQRIQAVQDANPNATVLKSPTVQAYIDEGTVTLPYAQKAATILDAIVSGKKDSVSGSEIDCLMLTTNAGAKVASQTLGLEVPRSSTKAAARANFRVALEQYIQKRAAETNTAAVQQEMQMAEAIPISQEDIANRSVAPDSVTRDFTTAQENVSDTPLSQPSMQNTPVEEVSDYSDVDELNAETVSEEELDPRKMLYMDFVREYKKTHKKVGTIELSVAFDKYRVEPPVGLLRNEYSSQVDANIVDAVDELAKLFGLDIRFDDLGNDNGYYLVGTNKVVIDIHPLKSGTVNPFLFTASHELGHAIRDRLGADAWSAFETYAIAAMGGESSVKDKQTQSSVYRDVADAREDVACDFLGKLLSDKATLDAFCASVRNGAFNAEHAKGIAGLIRRIVQKIRNSKQFSSAIEKQFGENIDAAKKAAQAILEAAESAVKAKESTADEGSATKYAKKAKAETEAVQKNGESDSIKMQIAAASDQLNGMDPVAVIVAPFEGGSKIDEALQWTRKHMAITEVDRKGYGKVSLADKWLKEGLGYTAKNTDEIAAILAVPAVIKRGIKIGHNPNHKGRGFSTTTFGAPVEINGVRGNMGVVVKETKPWHYHAHRILLPDGTVFAIPETENAEPSTAVGHSPKENGFDTPISSASTNIITESTQKSNTPKVKKSVKTDADIAQRDADYIAAVESGDLETAQRMVEEAAERAGYIDRLYHGTKQFGFTKFDTEKSDDKSSFFLAGTDALAQTYSGKYGIKRISDAENVDNLSIQDVVARLTEEAAADEDGMQDEYQIMHTEDVKALERAVDQGIDTLQEIVRQKIDEYAEQLANDFDEKDYKTHKMLVKLQESLQDYLYDQLSTPIYMLLKHTDAFDQNVHPLEKTDIEELEANIRLTNRLKNTDTRDGVVVNKQLGGYGFAILSFDDAKAELKEHLSSGNYALFGKPGKQFVVDAKGSNWNDITYYEDIPEVLKRYYPNGLWARGSTRDISTYAREHGYDSVRIENVFDNGGRGENAGAQTVYIYFNPNNLKSADPTVYDDEGNVIPLSERFNEKKTDIRYSKKDVISAGTEELYKGKNLSADASVYDYDFLVSLPPMNVPIMPPLSSVKDAKGINRDIAVNLGMKNAATYGDTMEDGTVALPNRYTGHSIALSRTGLEHSLDGNADRLRTNSRLAAIAGDLVVNAVPINALTNESPTADGTYAMASLANSGDRNVVAIITVEMRTNKVLDFEFDEIVHSIAGRLQKEKSSLLATRALGNLSEAPDSATLDISIADFLKIVNSTHQSILSNSVLQHFGQIRHPDGHYFDRAKFSKKNGVDAVSENTQDREKRTPFVIPSKAEADRLAAKQAEIDRESERKRKARREAVMDELISNSPLHRERAKQSTKERMQELADKHGAIPQGENPVREVSVPQRTDSETKVRRTVRTAMESKMTPENMIPVLEQSVLDGMFNYIPIKNQKLIDNAHEWVESMNIEVALAEWMREAGHGQYSAELIAKGIVLYNNYANGANRRDAHVPDIERRPDRTRAHDKADYARTAAEILTTMSQITTVGAQITQFNRMIKQLSPESQLFSLKRNVAKLQEEISKKFKEKGKPAPVIEINPELRDRWVAELRKGNRADKEYLYDLENLIFEDIAKQVPKTFMDRWNAWRYLSMLGNPKTILRNFLGNVAFMPLKATKDAIAAGLERTLGKKLGMEQSQRTKTIQRVRSDKELLAFAGRDFESFTVKSMRDASLGRYSNSSTMSRLEHAVRDAHRTFNLKGLSHWQAITEKAMETAPFISDQAFMSHHYGTSFARAALARGYNGEMFKNGSISEQELDALRAIAMNEALKATYKDANTVSKFFSRRYRGENKLGKAFNYAVDGAMPFRTTPANVMVRAFEYSPLGLIKNIGDYKALKRGEISAAEFLDGVASSFTGIGMFGLGFLMKALGLIRVSADDDDKREGKQAYSLEIFGKSIPIDWIAPASIPFFMGAELKEIFQTARSEGVADAFVETVSMAFQPMLEMSMLSGMQDVLETFSFGDGSPDTGDMFLAFVLQPFVNYLGQSIPTVLGQIANGIEPHRTSTYVGNVRGRMTKNFVRMIAKYTEKIPFVDLWQVDYVDTFGRKQSNWQSPFEFILNVVDNMLNPAYVNDINVTDADAEIRRLELSTGKDVSPKRRGYEFMVSVYDEHGKKLSGEDVQLTAEQYEKYSIAYGEQFVVMLNALMYSTRYDALTDEQKVEAIDKIEKLADEYGKLAAGVGYQIAPSDADRKMFDLSEHYGISVAETYVLDLYKKQLEEDDSLDSLGRKILLTEAVSEVKNWSAEQRSAMFAHVLAPTIPDIGGYKATLDEKAQYKLYFGEHSNAVYGELLSNKAYQNADEDTKRAMLDAASELVSFYTKKEWATKYGLKSDSYDPATADNKYAAVIRSGLSFFDAFTAHQKFKEISDNKDAYGGSANRQLTEFEHWINSQEAWNDEQKDAVKSEFDGFGSYVPASAEKYNELRALGFSDDLAKDVRDRVSELPSDATQYTRLMTAIETPGMSDAQQWKYARDFYKSSESKLEKFSAAKSAGFSCKSYMKHSYAIDNINGEDLDNNGQTDTGSRKRNIAQYLRNAKGLTDSQKNMLWSSIYSGKSNTPDGWRTFK